MKDHAIFESINGRATQVSLNMDKKEATEFLESLNAARDPRAENPKFAESTLDIRRV